MGLPAGTLLGIYEIVAPLGAGGMGEVYRAHDPRLGRDVAVKILPAGFEADADRTARFQREAKVLASLNHPNVASIYGLEESNRTRVLVMELVEGPTLAERVMQGPLPLDEALPIARQISEGLEYAHERGIIHRDLKPLNVKLTSDNQVKILDFGLAKALEGETQAEAMQNSPTLSMAATGAGMLLGTAAYMSPEQARGRRADRRADIWAFGALLFEMLVGKPLYEGDTTSEILARVIEREADLNRLPASTPMAIRELLRRCLTKNPRQRLRDIGDARIAIEEYLADPVGMGPAPNAVQPLSNPLQGMPWLWLIAGLVIGAFATGIVIWKLMPAASSQTTMRFSAVTNFTGIDAHPSFSPDGRSVAFISNRGGSFDIWVGLVTGGSPVRITSDPNFKARPHWSPDGSRISFNRLNESGLWDIWAVPALGGTPRKLLSNANDSAWSPDGMSLAYTDFPTRTIRICDASGGNARDLTQAEDVTWHLQPAFSHDGRRVAFVRRGAGPHGELAWVNVSTGKVKNMTEDRALALSPVWSVDNQYVYFASTRGGSMNLWKVSAEGGSPVQITAGRGDDSDLDLSADGRRIVFDSQRWATNLLEVGLDPAAEVDHKWLTMDASRGTLAPAYSPDGQHIAYFTNRKGTENESIWMMDANGSNPVQLVEDAYLNVFPRWTRDGKSLIFTARHRGVATRRILRRLNLSETVPIELSVEPGESSWGDVGPDGRLLFRGRNGLAQIFDFTKNNTESLDAVRGGYLHWSPDSLHISSIISARYPDDPESGMWVYDSKGGAARQVFRGWVANYVWSSAKELFVVEGKPDLTAVLWRVRLDGTSPIRTQTALRLNFNLIDIDSPLSGSPFRFDVHPDGRRIVVEAFRFQESDISMIEGAR